MKRGILAVVALLAIFGCGVGGDHWVETIVVAPASVNLQMGQTVQFTATATYNNRIQADVSTQVVWSTTTKPVLSITGTGFATPVACGTTDVVATSGPALVAHSTVVGRATVTVC